MKKFLDMAQRELTSGEVLTLLDYEEEVETEDQQEIITAGSDEEFDGCLDDLDEEKSGKNKQQYYTQNSRWRVSGAASHCHQSAHC